MIRNTFVILWGISLAFFAFGELGLAYPVGGWLYLLAFAAFATGLIAPGSMCSQGPQLAVVGHVVLRNSLVFRPSNAGAYNSSRTP